VVLEVTEVQGIDLMTAMETTVHPPSSGSITGGFAFIVTV